MQELTEIIKEFQELFDEPKSLPPKKGSDHTIPLIPRAKPINISPCKILFQYIYKKKHNRENGGNNVKCRTDSSKYISICSPNPFSAKEGQYSEVLH